MARSSHRAVFAALFALCVVRLLTAAGPVAADQTRPLETAKPLDLQGIASNGQTIVSVGAGGKILSSVDGGRRWLTQNLPGAALIDVVVCPDRSFIALDFYRRVWVGANDASQWRARALPGDATPAAITCSQSGAYWVVGSYSTVFSSTDQGANWQQSDFNEDAQLTAIHFVDAQMGYIAGEFGLVMKTLDAGVSWRALPRIADEFFPFDAWFESAQSGWLTGRGGKLLHTADGGLSWTEEPQPFPGLPMYRLVGSKNGLHAIGELGVVLRRDADQQRWLAVAEPLGGYLRGGVVDSRSTLIVVGGGGLPTPFAIAESSARH